MYLIYGIFCNKQEKLISLIIRGGEEGVRGGGCGGWWLQITMTGSEMTLAGHFLTPSPFLPLPFNFKVSLGLFL